MAQSELQKLIARGDVISAPKGTTPPPSKTTTPPTKTTGAELPYQTFTRITGKSWTPEARNLAYKEYGITAPIGSAEANLALQKAMIGGIKPTTEIKTGEIIHAPYVDLSKVNTMDEATKAINAEQGADFAQKEKEAEPPTKGGTFDIFGKVKETITPTEKLPEAPSYKERYEALRGEQKVSDLETQLTEATQREETIRAETRQRISAETGKPVAMGVIAGRVGEVERQQNERLDAVLREKNYITNQLKVKYDVIDNVMKLEKLDYDTATDRYDKSFQQNLNMFNLVKGISDTQKTDEERKIDNARSNLQVIYNNLTAGGVDISSIDDATKMTIQKLEMQSGLPVGFYTTLKAKNPKADVLSTTTRVSGTSKYADIIMKNEDGSLTTKSVFLGTSEKEGGADKLTEAEQIRQARSTTSRQLKTRAGDDGYLDPKDYILARSNWVDAGYAADDFDKSFNIYVNPNRVGDYNIKTY